MPITGISYLMYRNKSFDTESFDTIGLLLVALQSLYLTIYPLGLLYEEWKARRKQKYQTTTPAAWISLLWILIPSAISLWLSITVQVLWASWIAGV
tara:strand:+ start:767 stop:1054 length:288 start_codon:yes stop_codon:yes gene_type:complete